MASSTGDFKESAMFLSTFIAFSLLGLAFAHSPELMPDMVIDDMIILAPEDFTKPATAQELRVFGLTADDLPKGGNSQLNMTFKVSKMTVVNRTVTEEHIGRSPPCFNHLSEGNISCLFNLTGETQEQMSLVLDQASKSTMQKLGLGVFVHGHYRPHVYAAILIHSLKGRHQVEADEEPEIVGPHHTVHQFKKPLSPSVVLNSTNQDTVVGPGRGLTASLMVPRYKIQVKFEHTVIINGTVVCKKEDGGAGEPKDINEILKKKGLKTEIPVTAMFDIDNHGPGVLTLEKIDGSS